MPSLRWPLPWILCLSVVASPLAAQDRYTDPQGRFSLTIPPGWEATTPSADAVTISNGTGQLTLIMDHDASADSLLGAYFGQYAVQWSDWRELKRERVTLAGANGRSISVSGRSPRGVASILRLAAVDTPTGALLVLTSGPQDGFSSLRPTLEGIEGGIVLNSRIRPAPAGSPSPTQPVATRAFLGVGTRPIEPGEIRELGLRNTDGAMVGQLYPGGPAEEAGVAVGDVILAVDGGVVVSPQALTDAIARHRAGDGVIVSVMRQGKRGDLRVELRSPPER